MHVKHCAPTQTFACAKYVHDAISFMPFELNMPHHHV